MAQPRVLILQHAAWERPGRILDSLEEVGLAVNIDSIVDDKKPKLPSFDSVAGVVLMGGPMRATDVEDHPGLKAEAKLAKACVTCGKPLLGVCLGHQILATALGAKLKQAKSAEIGYGPIQRVDKHDYFSMFSKSATVLNWHSDSVSVPSGGQLLATSESTKNQAFRMGSALGLQFHLEVTGGLLEQWLQEPAMIKGLKKSQIAQIRQDFADADSQIKVFADSVFSGFAARCLTYARSLE
ncbi:MAG: type 1 glutamine amidotransferase [Bifidobacteriaceae bacterium]|nr:type 1 glutamine amidotransferase [Bifidobacteriaceae bacterium]MCI1915330.1 type 1 glutamine amidotransferase [Bifidobacteriaceae bacterium]